MTRPSVFLVGPMGAGKSTIGRLLAAELHLPFKDTDHEIEERCGADIPWIFDVEGEEGFRDRETAMLAELAEGEQMVLATGGGIVQRPENRELLLTGFTVYLHTSVKQQVERTAKDRKRPLLQTEDPRAVLEALMERRDPLYREVAKLVVSTDNRTARALATEIANELQQYVA